MATTPEQTQAILSHINELNIRLTLVEETKFSDMLAAVLPKIITLAAYNEKTIKMHLIKLHSLISKRIKVLKDKCTLPICDLVMLYHHFAQTIDNYEIFEKKLDFYGYLYTTPQKHSIQQMVLYYIDLALDLLIYQTGGDKSAENIQKSVESNLKPKTTKTVLNSILSGIGVCLLDGITSFTMQSNPTSSAITVQTTALKLIVKLLNLCAPSSFFASHVSETVSTVLMDTVVSDAIMLESQKYEKNRKNGKSAESSEPSTFSLQLKDLSLSNSSNKCTDIDREILSSYLLHNIPTLAFAFNSNNPLNSSKIVENIENDQNLTPKLNFLKDTIIDTLISPRTVSIQSPQLSNPNAINTLFWSLPSPLIIEYHKRQLFSPKHDTNILKLSPISKNEPTFQTDLGIFYENNPDLELFAGLLCDILLFHTAQIFVTSGESNETVPGYNYDKFIFIKKLISQSIPVLSGDHTSKSGDISTDTAFLQHYGVICANITEMCSQMGGIILYFINTYYSRYTNIDENQNILINSANINENSKDEQNEAKKIEIFYNMFHTPNGPIPLSMVDSNGIVDTIDILRPFPIISIDNKDNFSNFNEIIEYPLFLKQTARNLSDLSFVYAFFTIYNEQYLDFCRQKSQKSGQIEEMLENQLSLHYVPSYLLCLDKNITISTLTYQHCAYAPFSTTSTPPLPFSLFFPLIMLTSVSYSLQNTTTSGGNNNNTAVAWTNPAIDTIKLLFSTNNLFSLYFEKSRKMAQNNGENPVISSLFQGIKRLYNILLGDSDIPLSATSTPTRPQSQIPAMFMLLLPPVTLGDQKQAQYPSLSSLFSASKRNPCAPGVKIAVIALLSTMHTHATRVIIARELSETYENNENIEVALLNHNNETIEKNQENNVNWLIFPSHTVLLAIIKDCFVNKIKIITQQLNEVSQTSQLVPQLKYILSILGYLLILFNNYERFMHLFPENKEKSSKIGINSSKNTNKRFIYHQFLSQQIISVLIKVFMRFITQCDVYITTLSATLTQKQSSGDSYLASPQSSQQDFMQMLQSISATQGLHPSSMGTVTPVQNSDKMEQKKNATYLDTQPISLLIQIKGEVSYTLSVLCTMSNYTNTRDISKNDTSGKNGQDIEILSLLELLFQQLYMEGMSISDSSQSTDSSATIDKIMVSTDFNEILDFSLQNLISDKSGETGKNSTNLLGKSLHFKQVIQTAVQRITSALHNIAKLIIPTYSTKISSNNVGKTEGKSPFFKIFKLLLFFLLFGTPPQQLIAMHCIVHCYPFEFLYARIVCVLVLFWAESANSPQNSGESALVQSDTSSLTTTHWNRMKNYALRGLNIELYMNSTAFSPKIGHSTGEMAALYSNTEQSNVLETYQPYNDEETTENNEIYNIFAHFAYQYPTTPSFGDYLNMLSSLLDFSTSSLSPEICEILATMVNNGEKLKIVGDESEKFKKIGQIQWFNNNYIPNTGINYGKTLLMMIFGQISISHKSEKIQQIDQKILNLSTLSYDSVETLLQQLQQSLIHTAVIEYHAETTSKELDNDKSLQLLQSPKIQDLSENIQNDDTVTPNYEDTGGITTQNRILETDALFNHEKMEYNYSFSMENDSHHGALAWYIQKCSKPRQKFEEMTHNINPEIEKYLLLLFSAVNMSISGTSLHFHYNNTTFSYENCLFALNPQQSPKISSFRVYIKSGNVFTASLKALLSLLQLSSQLTLFLLKNSNIYTILLNFLKINPNYLNLTIINIISSIIALFIPFIEDTRVIESVIIWLLGNNSLKIAKNHDFTENNVEIDIDTANFYTTMVNNEYLVTTNTTLSTVGTLPPLAHYIPQPKITVTPQVALKLALPQENLTELSEKSMKICENNDNIENNDKISDIMSIYNNTSSRSLLLTIQTLSIFVAQYFLRQNVETLPRMPSFIISSIKYISWWFLRPYSLFITTQSSQISAKNGQLGEAKNHLKCDPYHFLAWLHTTTSSSSSGNASNTTQLANQHGTPSFWHDTVIVAISSLKHILTVIPLPTVLFCINYTQNDIKIDENCEKMSDSNVQYEKMDDNNNETINNNINFNAFLRNITLSVFIDAIFLYIQYALLKSHRNLQNSENLERSTNTNTNTASNDMSKLASSTTTTNVALKLADLLAILPISINNTTFNGYCSKNIEKSGNNQYTHKELQEFIIKYMFTQLKTTLTSIFFVDIQLSLAQSIVFTLNNTVASCPLDWLCDSWCNQLVPVKSYTKIINNGENNNKSMALYYNITNKGPYDYQIQFEQQQRQLYQQKQQENDRNDTENSHNDVIEDSSKETPKTIQYSLIPWTASDIFTIPHPQQPYFIHKKIDGNPYYIIPFQPPIQHIAQNQANLLQFYQKLNISPHFLTFSAIFDQIIALFQKTSFSSLSIVKKHSFAYWLLAFITYSYPQSLFSGYSENSPELYQEGEKIDKNKAKLENEEKMNVLSSLQNALLLLISDNNNLLLREVGCLSLTSLFHITTLLPFSPNSTKSNTTTLISALQRYLYTHHVHASNLSQVTNTNTSNNTILCSLIDLFIISSELHQPGLVYVLLSTTLSSAIWSTSFFSQYTHNYSLSPPIPKFKTRQISHKSSQQHSSFSRCSINADIQGDSPCLCANLPPQLLSLVPKLLIYQYDSSSIIVKQTMSSLLLLLAPHLSVTIKSYALYILKSVTKRMKNVLHTNSQNAQKVKVLSLQCISSIMTTVNTGILLSSVHHTNNWENKTIFDKNEQKTNNNTIIQFYIDIWDVLTALLHESNPNVVTHAFTCIRHVIKHVITLFSMQQQLFSQSSQNTYSFTLKEIQDAVLHHYITVNVPKGLNSTIKSVYVPTLLLLYTISLSFQQSKGEYSVGNNENMSLLSYIPTLFPLIIETMSVKDPLLFNTLPIQSLGAILDGGNENGINDPRRRQIIRAMRPQQENGQNEPDNPQNIRLNVQNGPETGRTLSILEDQLTQLQQNPGNMGLLTQNMQGIDVFRLKANENSMLYSVTTILLSLVLSNNESVNRHSPSNSINLQQKQQKTKVLSSTIDTMLMSIINNSKYSTLSSFAPQQIVSSPTSETALAANPLTQLEGVLSTITQSNNSHLLSLQGSLYILSNIIELAYKQQQNIPYSLQIAQKTKKSEKSNNNFILNVVLMKLNTIIGYLYRALRVLTAPAGSVGGRNTELLHENSINLVLTVTSMISYCAILSVPQYYAYKNGLLSDINDVEDESGEKLDHKKDEKKSKSQFDNVYEIIPKMVNTIYKSLDLSQSMIFNDNFKKTNFTPGAFSQHHIDVNTTSILSCPDDIHYDVPSTSSSVITSPIINMLIFQSITQHLSIRQTHNSNHTDDKSHINAMLMEVHSDISFILTPLSVIFMNTPLFTQFLTDTQRNIISTRIIPSIHYGILHRDDKNGKDIANQDKHSLDVSLLYSLSVQYPTISSRSTQLPIITAPLSIIHNLTPLIFSKQCSSTQYTLQLEQAGDVYSDIEASAVTAVITDCDSSNNAENNGVTPQISPSAYYPHVLLSILSQHIVENNLVDSTSLSQLVLENLEVIYSLASALVGHNVYLYQHIGLLALLNISTVLISLLNQTGNKDSMNDNVTSITHILQSYRHLAVKFIEHVWNDIISPQLFKRGGKTEKNFTTSFFSNIQPHIVLNKQYSIQLATCVVAFNQLFTTFLGTQDVENTFKITTITNNIVENMSSLLISATSRPNVINLNSKTAFYLTTWIFWSLTQLVNTTAFTRVPVDLTSINIPSLQSVSLAVLPSVHQHGKNSEISGKIENSASINHKHETILYEYYIELLVVYLHYTMVNGANDVITSDLIQSLITIPCVGLTTYTSVGALLSSLSLLNFIVDLLPALRQSQNVDNLFNFWVISRLLTLLLPLLNDNKRQKVKKIALITTNNLFKYISQYNTTHDVEKMITFPFDHMIYDSIVSILQQISDSTKPTLTRSRKRAGPETPQIIENTINDVQNLNEDKSDMMNTDQFMLIQTARDCLGYIKSFQQQYQQYQAKEQSKCDDEPTGNILNRDI